MYKLPYLSLQIFRLDVWVSLSLGDELSPRGVFTCYVLMTVTYLVHPELVLRCCVDSFHGKVLCFVLYALELVVLYPFTSRSTKKLAGSCSLCHGTKSL